MNISRDARNPNGTIAIPLDNHTDLPENSKNWPILDLKLILGIFEPSEKTEKTKWGQFSEYIS